MSLQLAILLALVGGFLDAYTYVGRDGVFANAQTGNVVLMALAAAQNNWAQAVNHLPSILAFVLGAMTAEILQRPAAAGFLRRPARVAVILEVLVLAAVGFLPSAVPDQVVIIAISYASALQVTSFRTVKRWTYNTTMTTGNLRSTAQAVVHAVLDRDTESRAEALHLGAVILAFAAGAALGGVLTTHLGDPAIWVAAALLSLSLVLFISDERRPVVRLP